MSDEVQNVRLGGITQCDSPRQIQLFGSVATPDGTPANFVPITTVLDATEQIPCFYTSDVERLWRIRTSGVELQRSAGDGEAPLTRPVILGPATPAGASRGGSVTYKLRVRMRSKSGNYQFLMDAGQAIEIYGSRPQVAVVGPSNAFEVTPVTNADTRQGLIIDSILGVSILAAEEALSQNEVRFTQHVFVGANTQVSIPVPEHSQRIKVFTGTGTPAASWGRFLGEPVTVSNALQVGTVDFVGSTSATQSDAVGDETHIQTDLDVNNDRFFTIVWAIRP